MPQKTLLSTAPTSPSLRAANRPAELVAQKTLRPWTEWSAQERARFYFRRKRRKALL